MSDRRRLDRARSRAFGARACRDSLRRAVQQARRAHPWPPLLARRDPIDPNIASRVAARQEPT